MDGKDLTPATFQTLYDKFLEEIRVEYKCFRTTRHTYASNLAENGTNFKAIKKLAGHSAIGMTEEYVHISVEALQRETESIAHLYV